MQFIYEKSTNIRYSIIELISQTPEVSEEKQSIFLLGTLFCCDAKHSIKHINAQIARFLSNVAWFSYRKHLDPIICQEPMREITNDSGWGCMIRAGQMCLYMTILKLKNPEKFGVKSSQADNKSFAILRSFFVEKTNLKLKKSKSDESLNKQKLEKKRNSEIGIFALQNFVKTAREKYNLKEGSWFRPTTFLLSLKKLLKKAPELSELRVQNVFENCFYLKDLCKKAFNNFESESIKSVEEAVELLGSKEWDNSVMLNVCTMLGLGNIDVKYRAFLKGLVEVESFVGMLGGCKQRAYYFVGHGGDLDFYYLDPHYVRCSLENFEDDKVLKEEYFEKTFMCMNYLKLSSSLAVCYLLKNKGDFRKFWAVLKSLEEIYQDDYFMAYFLEQDNTELEEGDVIILD